MTAATTLHLSDEQAQRLVDGVLAGAEAAEARRHADGCAACEALVASYEALGDALGDLAVPELPSDFTDVVLARIETREREVARERRHALAICGAVTAAVALAAALAGAGSWAPAASGLVDAAFAWAGALRLSSEVVPPVLSAMRLHVAIASALLVIPLLFALSRLMPSPRTELA